MKQTCRRRHQSGGGCRLCGSNGTNSKTCPLNANSTRHNPDKHPLAAAKTQNAPTTLKRKKSTTAAKVTTKTSKRESFANEIELLQERYDYEYEYKTHVMEEIDTLQTELTKVDAQLQTYTAELQELIRRSKLTNEDFDKYSGAKWDRAIKWMKGEEDEYVTHMALKYIPNAKKGEAQYEYAFYEPSNRRDATCGRGLVGTHFDEADCISATSRDGMCKLFKLTSTNDPDTWVTFNHKFDVFENQKDMDERDADLYNAITHLIRGVGFVEV